MSLSLKLPKITQSHAAYTSPDMDRSARILATARFRLRLPFLPRQLLTEPLRRDPLA